MQSFFSSFLAPIATSALGGILSYGSSIAQSLGGGRGIANTVAGKIGSKITPFLNKLGIESGDVDKYLRTAANKVADKGEQWASQNKFAQALADVGRTHETLVRNNNISVPSGGQIGASYRDGIQSTMDNVTGKDRNGVGGGGQDVDMAFQNGITKDNNAADIQQ